MSKSSGTMVFLWPTLFLRGFNFEMLTRILGQSSRGYISKPKCAFLRKWQNLQCLLHHWSVFVIVMSLMLLSLLSSLLGCYSLRLNFISVRQSFFQSRQGQECLIATPLPSTGLELVHYKRLGFLNCLLNCHLIGKHDIVQWFVLGGNWHLTSCLPLHYLQGAC